MKAVDEYRALIERASNGDPDARDFLTTLIHVAHVWDDLIDGDKIVVPEQIHCAFEAALLWLPRNPFYQRHAGELNVLLQNSIRNWQLANEIERSRQIGLYPASFVLRSSYADIVAQVAYITGGPKLALTIGMEARSQAHAEGFEGYLTNLDAELAAREN